MSKKKLSPTMRKVLCLMRDGAELRFDCGYWRIGGDVLNVLTVCALKDRAVIVKRELASLFVLTPAGRAAVAGGGK